jgi:AmmeMemoRadiSam system protein B/AmmeMemoRadiSam system protein A
VKEGILTTIISFILIVAILVGAIWFLSHNSKKEEEANMDEVKKEHQGVRHPAVAGQFYPADAKELANQVDGFLDKTEIVNPEKKVLGLVVPHAGYVYSGQVAAWGFGQLKDASIDTVILIGNSHRAYFDGAAVYEKGYFKTPLGEVEIDANLAQKIISENKIIKADVKPHKEEHSLEVEVPFLQRVLKNFKVVPILMGSGDLSDVKILAQAISKNIIGKNIMVVASADMSHYPLYKDANYADKKTYEAILSGSVDNLENTITALEHENITNAQTFLCAKDAVEVLMLVMQDLGVKDIKLLKYLNSGDTAGDKSQVVGYSAIAFYGERLGGELSKTEEQKLLEIAKQTVEVYVKTGQTPDLTEANSILNQKLGVFVTLKKHGELRGCIGNFTGSVDWPLWQNVQKMAIAAATQDPRFLPITAGELPDLEYEVSVLSPLQKIDDWHKIQLGKHGVEIKSGLRSGVFLPQVAQETGWDLETFMGQLCSQKAGLPWDCWKNKDTEIYTFTAQVFGEKE